MTSEERFGEILPRVRDKIVLSSKFEAREVGACLKEIETSLKRLKTDYFDKGGSRLAPPCGSCDQS